MRRIYHKVGILFGLAFLGGEQCINQIKGIENSLTLVERGVRGTIEREDDKNHLRFTASLYNFYGDDMASFTCLMDDRSRIERYRRETGKESFPYVSYTLDEVVEGRIDLDPQYFPGGTSKKLKPEECKNFSNRVMFENRFLEEGVPQEIDIDWKL